MFEITGAACNTLQRNGNHAVVGSGARSAARWAALQDLRRTASVERLIRKHGEVCASLALALQASPFAATPGPTILYAYSRRPSDRR